MFSCSPHVFPVFSSCSAVFLLKLMLTWSPAEERDSNKLAAVYQVKELRANYVSSISDYVRTIKSCTCFSATSYQKVGRFCANTDWYLELFIIPSTLTKAPVPAEEKQPQSMMPATTMLHCSGRGLMSAPPLDDPPTMPTMVSRLPKFGSRPKSVKRSPAGAQTASADRPFCRAPPPLLHRYPPPMPMGSTTTRAQGGDQRHNNCPPCLCETERIHQSADFVFFEMEERKRVGKGRGFGYPAPPSLSPSPQSSPRTLPVSKGGPAGSRQSQAAFGLLNGSRPTHNRSKPRGGANGSLRPPQSFVRSAGSRPSSGPGSRSGSPLQKKPPASRSHSSDSLGPAASVQLTESDRYRSRSLTQVRPQPSPNLTPSSISSPTTPQAYSGKSPTSSNQAPSRDGSTKSIQSPEGGGRASATPGRSGVSVPSLLPPSALKKPLLPNYISASKPSGISYKLSRPSLIKQSRPVRVTSANDVEEANRGLTARRNSVETPSTTESTPETPETEGLSADPVSQGEVSIVGETLEDMSLSSNSSLDRNDTSQEYMDDFDNLGNGGVGMLLLSAKNDEDDSGLDQSCPRFDDEDKVAVNGVAKATGLCFLDDGVGWAGVRFSGERGEHQLTRRRRSSQPDRTTTTRYEFDKRHHGCPLCPLQGGSSLDLSPSDSCGSGGTYMWDEEGLEPLGGAATTASINTNSNTTHHIGSFDSDLNSIDILNNLDSCDLDEDDLMLDVDVLEDASLHSGVFMCLIPDKVCFGPPQASRTASDGDGMAHMAQWRRRQLCWGTQDAHNDNDSDFQCYKLTEDPGNKRTDTSRDRDLILDLCPPRSPGLGLDVEELAEDCSAVRSQLEHLHRLLLQEDDVNDDTLTTDTLSPETVNSSHSCDSHVQALLQEVQQLREELRSRDRTIAQLTLRLVDRSDGDHQVSLPGDDGADGSTHSDDGDGERERRLADAVERACCVSSCSFPLSSPGSISAPGLTGGGRSPAFPPTSLEKTIADDQLISDSELLTATYWLLIDQSSIDQVSASGLMNVSVRQRAFSERKKVKRRRNFEMTENVRMADGEVLYRRLGVGRAICDNVGVWGAGGVVGGLAGALKALFFLFRSAFRSLVIPGLVVGEAVHSPGWYGGVLTESDVLRDAVSHVVNILPMWLTEYIPSQILHSSHHEDQKPLTDQSPPLTQAPPPASDPASTQPAAAHSTTEGVKDDGKRVSKEEEKGERKGAYSRSLQPPQPSRLRLFTSHAAAATSAKTRAARQQLHEPDSAAAAGLIVFIIIVAVAQLGLGVETETPRPTISPAAFTVSEHKWEHFSALADRQAQILASH
ncbi:hypothetical protein L3Q82_010128 [Scortum barcoo]|uniref:Uncharacterized protein n=1 Tax=Scortum barcoo TaxID=214431 RepID=A0ACB8WC29_9TELE|nr:hypothetical protein L3Q82_010128 [Scortum barcoo]